MDRYVAGLDPTGDNRACLQAALGATQAEGGGVVLVPPGRWPLSPGLRLPDHVTLRGVSLTASVLQAIGGGAPLLIADQTTTGSGTGEGWAVECLTLDGGADAGSGSGATHGIWACGDASFVILRQLRIRNMLGDAIRCSEGQLGPLFVENIAIQQCGHSALVIAPAASSSALFLSDVTIHEFGLERSAFQEFSTAVAVHLQARCHISQLHIAPVRDEQIGVMFDRGSDYTVVSGLYVGAAGGSPHVTANGVVGVSISTEAVRQLGAP